MGETVDIAQLIHRGGVFMDIEGSTPQEIYEQISRMIELPVGVTSEQVYNALCAREQVLSTAVGNGIALPHARSPIMKDVTDQKICVVYLKHPIEMKAPDDKPVHTMFILLTQNAQVHLQVISSLAALFRSSTLRTAIEHRADEAKLYSIIRDLQ